jgi:tripartite-type tricarboxylate transporter receptor subunit TctC
MPARREFLRFGSAAAVTAAAPSLVSAQTYPTRPARLIVGFVAGGAWQLHGARQVEPKYRNDVRA